MAEKLSENEDPREQACKARMEEWEKPVDPARLYSLQLAVAGLDEGVRPRAGDRPELEEALGVALGWAPKDQAALVESVPAEQIEGAASPRQAASILIAELVSTLAERL